MDRISLWYCEGASDKVYQAEIVPVSDGFQVNFAYGRRAGTMNTGTKTSKPVPYAQAKKIFDTLVHAKIAKGYEPMGAPIKVCLLSRICGAILVPGVVPSCDKGQFP